MIDTNIGTDAKTLSERIENLGYDERAILESLLCRLEKGREVYGNWNVNDGRDYQKESLDEVIDALHYCAAALLKQMRRASLPRTRRKIKTRRQR